MKNRYQDLEYLLFVGFIPLKTRIGGVNFVFKSLNEIEYDQVKMMSGIEEDPLYNLNFHINYLFYSIYMVNGINILKNRFESYSEIADILRTYPNFIIKHIFKSIDELVKRAEKCVRLIEPYSYESTSRYNWTCNRHHSLNDIKSTGIPGTEYLSLNQFQKYWILLNRREDSKERFDQEYSLFKFLASFTDSKAVRKVDGVDKNREEEEKKRRERIRVIGTPEEAQYLSGPSETAEDLVAALNKQMAGEKDEHDLYIEEYEKSLRFEMLKQMQEMKKRREERHKVLSEETPLKTARPISPEEMAERIQKSLRDKDSVKVHDYRDNESKGKFLQMSNVDDDVVIKETNLMSEEDYSRLIKDDLFNGLAPNSNRAEELRMEYEKQQKRLAFKYGFDSDDSQSSLDFPNLRKG